MPSMNIIPECIGGPGSLQVAYEAVIGIECHVQLNTHTKAFCGCSTSKAPINVNVCPICLGHPVRCHLCNDEHAQGTAMHVVHTQ